MGGPLAESIFCQTFLQKLSLVSNLLRIISLHRTVGSSPNFVRSSVLSSATFHSSVATASEVSTQGERVNLQLAGPAIPEPEIPDFSTAWPAYRPSLRGGSFCCTAWPAYRPSLRGGSVCCNPSVDFQRHRRCASFPCTSPFATSPVGAGFLKPARYVVHSILSIVFAALVFLKYSVDGARVPDPPLLFVRICCR